MKKWAYSLRCIGVLCAVIMCTCFMNCGSAKLTLNLEIDPPPSDIRTAALLSGFSYSTGGEHYVVVHSIGSPLVGEVQESDNGHYTIK